MKITESVYAYVAAMLERMAAADHCTVWGEGNAMIGEEKTNVFVFFSVNADTAKRAKEVLEREGLLCDTDLGRWS